MESHIFKVSFLGAEYPSFYIKEREDALAALKKLDEYQGLMGLDTETMAYDEYKHISTAALSPHLSRVRLLQCSNGKASFVFDLLSINDDSIFHKFLTSHKFVAHNAVFEISFLRKLGIKDLDINCTYILSKLLFHACYPTDEGLSAGLGPMVRTVLKTDILKNEGDSDWAEPDLNFSQIEYAAIDAIATLKLWEKLSPGLKKLDLFRIYNLTKKAQHAIAEIQLNGIYLDSEKHRKLIPAWRDSLYAAKKELESITKLSKFTSTTIAEYIESILDVETLLLWPRTDTGKLSTDSHTLMDFSYLPIIKPFSEYQKKEKLLSTYGQTLIQTINPKTGRIHAGYNLCGARTGRLSSSHPNLQNLPRDSDIRKNFVAKDNNVIVCFDFSQIEIRVGAELSRDDVMLKAYRDGIDLHALTASTVARKPLKEVTKDERQMAKALNFGLMFGLGARKFSKYAKQSYGVDVTDEEAFKSVCDWHELYKGYTDYQQSLAIEASKTLLCKTPCGKLRRLPEDKTYGASMNQPVQGGAAEVMLSSLCRVYDLFGDTEVKLINSVHDEISVECSKSIAEDVKELLHDAMVKGFLDIFPEGITRGLVEGKIGQSWFEAH